MNYINSHICIFKLSHEVYVYVSKWKRGMLLLGLFY